MRRWVVVAAVVGACGGPDEGVPIDGPVVDAPEVDAPDVDAPEVDAPDLDAPVVDAPVVDAPVVDAPGIDAPANGLVVHTAGLGAGRIGGAGAFCTTGPCTYPAGAYQLDFIPIGDSVLAGVTGCTLVGNSCMVSGAGAVTATFSPITTPTQQATWIRTARVPASVADVALTGDGVIAAGAAESGGLWVARYLADATVGTAFVDASASVAQAVGVLAGGDAIVLTQSQLRRYSPAGALVWSISPGGSLGTNALAIGPTGIIYTAGRAAGVAYVAAFDSNGLEQWRTPVPAAASIDGLAVRGNLVAATGHAGGSGWVGTFDLAGVAGWTRAVRSLSLQQDIRLSDAGIDSDGDVIFGGLDIVGAPARYTLGAVNGSAAEPLWLTQHATRSGGDLAVRADDTVLLLLGYASAGNMDPARLIDHREDGVANPIGTVENVFLPGGLAVDGAGVTYLGGQAFFNFPAIERRPPPATSALTIQQTGTGTERLIVSNDAGAYFGECSTRTCQYDVTLGSVVTVRAWTPPAIATAIQGWTGPCLPSTDDRCRVSPTAAGVTVAVNSSALAPEVWFRGLSDATVPHGVAVTTTGVVVVGAVSAGSTSAVWMQRYATDGTPGPAFAESLAAGGHRAFAVAADPGGGFYVLGDAAGAISLRRYLDVGVLTWSTPIAGATDVATDADGNVYVTAGAQLLSYDRTATPRWARTVPATSVSTVAVRGDVVGVGGASTTGWVGAYDRAGTLQWNHQVQGAGMVVEDVAVRADGALAVLVLNPQLRFEVTIASASQAPPGATGQSGAFRNGVLALGPQDRAVSLQTLSGGVTVVEGVTGTHVTLNQGVGGRGALTYDAAAGALYLAGRSHDVPYVPLLIRSQVP